MTRQEILDELASIMKEVVGTEPASVTEDKTFAEDLDVDSLSMVEIAVELGNRVGVDIPDAEMANIKTVKDAVDYVEKAKA
jgi:acyl carrier protein